MSSRPSAAPSKARAARVRVRAQALIGPPHYVQREDGSVAVVNDASDAQPSQRTLQQRFKPPLVERGGGNALPSVLHLSIALLRTAHQLLGVDVDRGVDWKPLQVYPGQPYAPQVGDKIVIVVDHGDDSGTRHPFYLSKAGRWVKKMKVDDRSGREFQFDLHAQGGGAVPGMELDEDGFTGVLWFVDATPRRR